MGSPTHAKSKMDKEGRPASIAKPLTIRLVLVPINVTQPPKMAAYDSGISSLEGATLFSFDHELTYGIIIATKGVLLKNAENEATTDIMLSLKVLSFFCLPNKRLKITFTTEDFRNISLIISNIIITANCSFAKPCMASEGVKTPPITKNRMAIKKLTVGLNHSK